MDTIWELIGFIIWGTLISSVIVSIIGVASRIWWLLLVGSVLSLLFTLSLTLSVAGGMSFGWIILVLTVTQLVAAIAIRCSVAWWGWLALLSAGCLGWIAVVLIGPWTILD